LGNPVQEQSRAGSYAAIGAGAGLMTALLAILQVESDPNQEIDSSKVGPVTAGLVGVGTLIGLAIGSKSPVWERQPTGAEVTIVPLGESLVCAARISF
jgi:hypothetical protein